MIFPLTAPFFPFLLRDFPAIRSISHRHVFWPFRVTAMVTISCGSHRRFGVRGNRGRGSAIAEAWPTGVGADAHRPLGIGSAQPEASPEWAISGGMVSYVGGMIPLTQLPAGQYGSWGSLDGNTSITQALQIPGGLYIYIYIYIYISIYIHIYIYIYISIYIHIYIYIYFCRFGILWFSDSQLPSFSAFSCFSASLLLCFFASWLPCFFARLLLCLSASPLFCFPCFSAFQASLLITCFSAFPLLCFLLFFLFLIL